MPGMTDRDQFAAAALTGLLAQGDDGSFSEESYARGAYRWADAMLCERERTNRDAAPAARASVDSVAPQPTTDGRERTDKSPARTVDGTGESDRPKPIKSTPATHATHGEGSMRREGIQEPVAWGVAGSKGLLYATSVSRMDAVDMQSEHECDTHVVPLYRRPPCQDFSQKNWTLTDAEREAIDTAAHAAVQLYPLTGVGLAAVLRGLLSRLGGDE